MYYKPLKKKQIDVVVSRASSYSLLASLLLSLNLKIKIMTYKGSQQYQYQRLPELFWNPARHGKRKLRDVPQPLTGGQHAKFQGGL